MFQKGMKSRNFKIMKIGVFVFICLYACVAGIDEGFDLFFSTNLDEMTDVPIQFEKPLPTWLKGTLVSIPSLSASMQHFLNHYHFILLRAYRKQTSFKVEEQKGHKPAQLQRLIKILKFCM